MANETLRLTEQQCEEMRVRLMSEYRRRAAADIGPVAALLTESQWSEFYDSPMLSVSQAADLTVALVQQVLADISPSVENVKADNANLRDAVRQAMNVAGDEGADKYRGTDEFRQWYIILAEALEAQNDGE